MRDSRCEEHVDGWTDGLIDRRERDAEARRRSARRKKQQTNSAKQISGTGDSLTVYSYDSFLFRVSRYAPEDFLSSLSLVVLVKRLLRVGFD